MIYVDTSFMAKLYFPETLSEKAKTVLEKYQPPMIWTDLHRLEMMNAMSLKLFRAETDQAFARMLIQRVEDDLKEGFLRKQSVNWSEIMMTASQWAWQHSARIGTRSLDILHVATAVHLGARCFLTFDERQKKLAKTVKLEAP